MDSRQTYIELTDSNCAFSGKGAYSARLDRRGLYDIRHEYVPSETGNFGQIETEAVVPEGWKPPFALHFYASDDYYSEPNPKPFYDWWGIESYVGHRFKQVLINDEVVWEIDSGDGGSPSFCADITRCVTPGKPFKLTLRVFDKVGTDQILPEDFMRVGTTEGQKKPEDPRKFYTNVWWGDVAIREQDDGRTPMEPRELPGMSQLVTPPPSSFPLPPMARPWAGPIVLPIDTKSLPAQGFPVTCGVPLPYGAVSDVKRLALTDSGGSLVPAQFTLTNKWSDGSVRWVLLDVVAKPGEAPYELKFDGLSAKPASRARVTSGATGVTINTGALVLEFGTDDSVLIGKATLDGDSEPIAGDIAAVTVIAGVDGDEIARAVREEVKITSRGPIRAEVEVHGKLISEKRQIGRFVFLVAAYAGTSILRTFYRVYNDTEDTLGIKSVTLTMPTALGKSTRAKWTDASGACEDAIKGAFKLSQPRTEAWKVKGVAEAVREGEKATGWFEFAGDMGAVQVCARRFWQQHSKSIGYRKGAVEIGLFDSPSRKELFEQTSGEAKRHEMWMSFGRASGEALADCMLNPPRLFSCEYTAATGALGPCFPRTLGEFEDYSDYVKLVYGDAPLTDESFGYGVRHFGDYLFGAGGDQWRNNLYDTMLEALAEYRMSGNRNWFDRAADSALHVMDVDQCHYSSDSAKLGGVYSYSSANHTNGGFWDAMLRQGTAFAVYYRLTGDADARQAMVDLADHIVRNERGAQPGLSQRDYGGLMMTMVWAYDETGDKRYIRHCRRILEAVFDQRPRPRHETYVDKRRGAFSECHGNYDYPGNTPWMLAQLAEPLYGYWRLTGDPDAARAVVAFAESIVCEDMTPDVPGDFFGYSHNPQCGKTTTYNMLLGPMMMYAFDLTGDDYFLTCARDAYKEALRVLMEKPRTVLFWNVPTYLYFLHRAKV